MEMEMLEEFTKYKDQMILKRKRTKQLRPSNSSSSSGGGGGGGCGGGDRGGGNEFRSLVSSPTTTTTSSGISASTEEDEDMANCLILLAQSGDKVEKFRSRKFKEMANITEGKVGIYVYECKTCNRTFPSFQALGGHRASHRKPKSSSDDQKKSSPFIHDDEEEKRSIITRLSPPPSIQSSSKFDIKPKIHECSICGSEFSSGQALGGHMRRHRTAPNTTRIGTDDSEKPRNILDLDLNLPAPPEDDHRPDEKFNLIFSSPALVDCHY